MSATTEPETRPRASGFNLVALARPYFGLIVLTTTMLTALGFVLMLRMPSGIYPEVAFPRVVVIAQTPGLAVKDVEVAVTRPIEEAVSIVLGVVRVRSKSIRGAAELSIDFAPGTDMIQALNDVRARMAEVGSQLPPGTTTITERQTPSVFPIISFVVTGGKNPASLHDYAYYDLRPRISRIPDVSYVTVQGGDIREILVEVDPQSLASAGLSIADIADRLGKEHRLKAVGRLDREALQYQVLADTLAADPLDLEDRVIIEKNGQAIRLGDLGRVTISHQDRTMTIRSGGRDAVALTVFRRLGGNALLVSEELEKVLDDAAKSAPPGVTIHPVYDQAQLVRTSIANVRDAIIVGGLFSVVILLLFLKSWRATLIASLAIPLSLVISFVFLYLTGDTLNLMSLGGLAVAIGLIIDDTVVVIENIARHLASGDSGDAAVDRASKEISGAVVGSTLTTILVFLPLAFVRGVVGQFFQSLSLALTVALLVSMVVSLTIIPVLAARFLGRRPMPTSGPVYNLLANRYEGLLRGTAVPPGRRRLRAARRRARLVAVSAHGDGLHARDGRGRLRSRLRNARRNLALADRQGPPTGRGDPPPYPRRLRLYPPHRRGTRFLRDRGLHRRHPREPQTARLPQAHGRDLREPCARSSRPKCPSWRPSSSPSSSTRSATSPASPAPSRSRSSAPTSPGSETSPNRSDSSSRGSPAPWTSTHTSISETPTSSSAPTASRRPRSG